MTFKKGDFVLYKFHSKKPPRLGIVIEKSSRECQLIWLYKNITGDAEYLDRSYTRLMNIRPINNRLTIKQHLPQFKQFFKMIKKDNSYERWLNQDEARTSIEHYKSICLRDTKKWICFASAYAAGSIILLYLAFIYS